MNKIRSTAQAPAFHVSDIKVLRAFIYVARQVASDISCVFLGVVGGARLLAGKGWSWISEFTGCPHLFAEQSRPRVDTRMECCLHASEHGDFV